MSYRKVLCPYHDDTNPSMVIYPDAGHCFVCDAHVPIAKLGLKPESIKPKYVEDVARTIREIRKLPIGEFRGLKFHHDEQGFYVIWPNCDHYKKRLFQGEPKYKGPTGVRTPLFIAREQGHNTLVITEGEINALSITQALDGVDVVSPGASGDFYGPRYKEDEKLYCRYREILIITDKDQAGIIAGIKLKARLMELVPCVILKCVDKDANFTLMEYGSDALREEIESYMEVPKGVFYPKEPLQALGEESSECGSGQGTWGRAPSVS